MVPAKCYFCWQEIHEGDRVVARKLMGDEQLARADDNGTVQSVLASDDGSIYVIKTDSGKEVYMTRAEFRKRRENEA